MSRSAPYPGQRPPWCNKASVDVQSVPRFIAASIHAKAGIPLIKEEDRKPLLDYPGSPCKGLGVSLWARSLTAACLLIDLEYENIFALTRWGLLEAALLQQLDYQSVVHFCR